MNKGLGLRVNDIGNRRGCLGESIVQVHTIRMEFDSICIDHSSIYCHLKVLTLFALPRVVTANENDENAF